MRQLLAPLVSLLCLSAAPAFAQPEGYRGLEEFGDPTQEARQILIFEARAGDSLRATLSAWSKKAGWSEPQWFVPKGADFALGSTVRFEGDYKTATRSFVSALGAEANLKVSFDVPQRRAVLSLRDVTQLSK